MATIKARPLAEWTEEDGNVLWWAFPVVEPPYVGTPLDIGHTVTVSAVCVGGFNEMNVQVGGWPDYHTHWTPIEVPDEPDTITTTAPRP